MKKSLIYISCVAALIGSTSCGNFGDLNIDPENLNEENIPMYLLFTNGQHQMLGSDWDVWRNGCIYASQWVKHIASVNWGAYARYYWTNDYSAAFWGIYNGDSRGALRDIKTVIRAYEGDDYYSVDYNIARIMFAYGMHRMTDMYGDVPYSQAVQPDLYSYPEYDTQESIYMDLLNELNEAQANLENASTAVMGSADNFYQGDPEKWRKFANSLMVRVAMRMSKVNPTLAEQWVQTAVSNGVFESNDDDCMLMHSGGVTTDDSAEPYAKIYSHEDRGNFFLNKFFVDMLNEKDDPRISLIGTVCDDPTISVQSSGYEYGDSDPTIQRGLPDGASYSESSEWFIGTVYSDFYNSLDIPTGTTFSDWYRSHFSTVNRYTYSDPTGPTFVCTHAQTQLLLAEAALRGWISGDAATYYENGVRAAMAQFSHFPNGTTLYNTYIAAADIDAYLASTANKLDVSNYEDAMQKINEQYYINCFCDEYETFANWRRSGYPELTVPDFVKNYSLADTYDATEGATIPRRFRYPTDESQNNSANYNAAVSRLDGGDKFSSRMWWDVE